MSSIKSSARILVFHPGGLPVLTAVWHVLRRFPADTTISIVAPWHEASLSSAVLAIEPFDIQQREFLRLMQTPGPSALSPAIGELLANADLILTTLDPSVDAFSRNLRVWSPESCIIPLVAAKTGSNSDDQPLSSRFFAQIEEAGIELNAEPSAANQPTSDPGRPTKPLLIWVEDVPSTLWSADGPLLTPLLRELGARQESYRLFTILAPDKAHGHTPGTGSAAPSGRAPNPAARPDTLTLRHAVDALPIFREARAMLSPNLGPAHLADAVGLPTIIIQSTDEPASPLPATAGLVEIDVRFDRKPSADPIAEILAVLP